MTKSRPTTIYKIKKHSGREQKQILLKHYWTNFNKLVITNGKIQFGQCGPAGSSDQTSTALWL